MNNLAFSFLLLFGSGSCLSSYLRYVHKNGDPIYHLFMEFAANTLIVVTPIVAFFYFPWYYVIGLSLVLYVAPGSLTALIDEAMLILSALMFVVAVGLMLS